ncbi:YbaN family protein [Thalassoroseus pseudoceratinae]|uniref:YbaN family protein n=1 Tax=Thalassoroseus pseudoceratinae TaxID=2713176 RepID=UPI00141E2471|nr:YbaN family protein [Thalassoroseus pseudoceratinae]
MHRIVLTSIGLVSLALGFLGIILPLLPTTPFLLLSASCFCRSSPRLYKWLMNHPWFGLYIRSYREVRAIPFRAKVIAVSLLVVTIGYLVLFTSIYWLIKVAACTVALIVTIHILRLKSLTSEMVNDMNQSNELS